MKKTDVTMVNKTEPQTPKNKKKVIRILPCELTDADRAELERAIVHKKVPAAQAAAKLKILQETMEKLAESIREGIEEREVQCEEVYYYDAGKIVCSRIDTGEVVDERDMTPDERQLQFDMC